MEVFKTRLESFTRPKRGKGVKTQPGQKWPHPEYFLATPETLAEAGFYFDPSSEDKDNVTCYMCGKELSEWDERDDPFEIHYKKCGKKCAWANVRCGLGAEMNADGQFVFTDKNRLPTSKAMEKARLDTFLFGDGWIHDRSRNHGASSKKMAKAGFVYSPHDAHDDTAVCIYCGISLSGWDADDDPTEEHRSRVKKAGTPCPMFPDIVFAPPSNSSKSHSRSKSKSSHVDVTMPMKTYDGSDNETAASSNTRMGSVASSNTAKTPRASRAVKKGAKTPRSRSVSKSRTGSVDISEGDVDEHVAKPSKKATTSTRSRSVSRAKSVTSLVDSDPGTGTEDEVALQRSTSGRSTGKAKQPGTRDGSTDDERSAVSKKKGSKARSQSKTRVSMIPEDVSDEDTVEPPPPKSTKKSIARKPSTRAATTSKSRTKQKVVDPDSAEIAELPTKATSAENSKSLTDSVAAAAALFDDDELENPVEERVSEPEPATNTRSSRTTRKATKPPSQNAPHPTTRKQIAPAKAESRKPLPKIESRTSEHIEERADDDIDAEIELHVPPITSSSVEPESDTRLESNARSSPPPREIGNLQKLSKTKQKTIRAQNETQFPEQHADHPPPVPPRSPSRPRTKQSPLSTDTDGDRQNPPELRSDGDEKRSLERPRIPSGSRAGIRDTSAEPPLKQTVLPKPITMKKQGSFLSSRSSTQTRIGSSVDVVMDISSDEDDEDQVEAAIRLPETLPNQTKSRILPNSQAPSHAASTSTAMPTSMTTNQETLPFAKGTVQAKIAQIEKNVDPSCETNGRSSPYKSKLASNGSILESKPQIDGVKFSMLQDNDMQMAELSNPDNAGSEAKDESRKVSPLPRPAVTPPRSEHRAPASPFKTPFRFGMGAANPFSVPPTPGAPLDILCGGPIPLSQELFVSTQELSETELNMTVEDWVRYHMRIEYAKFKEDGEREIDKFQKRAEQVRNTIEAL